MGASIALASDKRNCRDETRIEDYRQNAQPPQRHFGNGCDLTTVIHCFQPLLFEICDYLTDSPEDMLRFVHESSQTLFTQCRCVNDNLWKQAYRLRWPPFYDALSFQGIVGWHRSYIETVAGNLEVFLEVFDREKKIGFAMSAMPARVRYRADTDQYIAKYISASAVEPEGIPADSDTHRLRFCPGSVRDQLKPGVKLSSEAFLAYPYRVLEGTSGLIVGQPVELQWKMQTFSPFGWWYGVLEALRVDREGRIGIATITFPHFPRDSAWYRLEVRFGDSEMNPCFFGGKTGGIRAVNPEEHKRWMKFMPKAPLVF